MFIYMSQGLFAGVHILPSGFVFINLNLCVGSDERLLQALFCAYATVRNEAPDWQLNDVTPETDLAYSQSEKTGPPKCQRLSWCCAFD